MTYYADDSITLHHGHALSDSNPIEVLGRKVERLAWGIGMRGDGISIGKSIVKCLHICHAQCMNMNAKAQCTCMDPAVACPACLARRDANGWPKSWRERMRTSLCPACGKSGVTVGLDCTLLETSPTVRPHACGVGGPGAGQ